MVRLTRAQQQERTRASVLAAAREEFTAHDYAAVKIDRIAERAELTRGAVYSNFPSKRALYLAVLIDLVESADTGEPPEPAASPRSTAEALGAFARAWLERLPLVDDTASGGRLQLRSLTGVLDDAGRAMLAQLARLEAVLLATALESSEPARAQPVRRVRLAELVLTLLDGSGHLAATAPGFGDSFDVARACEHLAGIDLADTWDPPHLPYAAPAQPCADTWDPPAGLADEIGGGRLDFGGDGLIAVLAPGRVAAAEEAIRSAAPGQQVTVAVVTEDRAETGRLLRLRVADLVGCLRRVFPAAAWQRLRLVIDPEARTPSALGLNWADDETEAAAHLSGGRIVARARGRGAAYAAAGAGGSENSESAPRSSGTTI